MYYYDLHYYFWACNLTIKHVEQLSAFFSVLSTVSLTIGRTFHEPFSYMVYADICLHSNDLAPSLFAYLDAFGQHEKEISFKIKEGIEKYFSINQQLVQLGRPSRLYMLLTEKNEWKWKGIHTFKHEKVTERNMNHEP
jgi:hypothetical protein